MQYRQIVPADAQGHMETIMSAAMVQSAIMATKGALMGGL